ncbi:MAG: hypothetical protein ACP5VE_08290 [Chthonomonadales bacterium]
MNRFRLLWRTASVVIAAVALDSWAWADVVVRRSAAVLFQQGPALTVPFLLVNRSHEPLSAPLKVQGLDMDVQATQGVVGLDAGAWRLVRARVALKSNADRGIVTCTYGGAAASVAVVRGLNLADRDWQWIPGSPGNAIDPAWLTPDAHGLGWRPLHPPVLWQNLGYSVCRVQFTVPAEWKGKILRLVMGAVDDNDITYLNSREIGRTNGWDVPRNYLCPAAVVRWGDVNTLTIVVENVNAGGGLYKPPFAIVVGSKEQAPTGLVPAAGQQEKLRTRPSPGKVGSALPLRPIHVSDGVLRYPDGSEVALWGTNYYPQSWQQYVHLRQLGIDIKKAIRRDLDDMQQMGIQIIRIHVFDREISGGDGGLIRNVHLDLLDYLAAQCNRRSLYLMLTPIAWWGSPVSTPGSFSEKTSKPGMMFVPAALDAEQRYLKEFLTHVNPYTGRRLVQEPCLCALEVQNEPAYFQYGDLFSNVYIPQGEAPEVISHDRAVLRRLWTEWLERNGLEASEANFHIFRYELMRRYIARMVDAIRAAGAHQPVAVSSFGVDGEDLAEAIGDSACDAITLSTYPGGWEHVNDGINLLPALPPMSLDAAYANKARIAYEFDAPATNVSCYLYPAIAAWMRSGEVQIACQFQYDSFYDARWNVDWAPHWLNLWYTPGKAVSFRAAGAAFAALERGVRYPRPSDHLVLGPSATSFAHNVSIYADGRLVCHSRPLRRWVPIRLPRAPAEIMGVGCSPYAEYGGTGAYTLRRRSPYVMDLVIRPDVELVGNSLLGSFQSPVANLWYHTHWFRLLLPGWSDARFLAWRHGRWTALPRCRSGVLLKPGSYRIVRSSGKASASPPPAPSVGL